MTAGTVPSLDAYRDTGVVTDIGTPAPAGLYGRAVLWAVRDDRTLSAHAKLCYLMLSSRAPDIRPSMAILAADMAVSKAAAKRAVRELREAGLITVRSRMTAAGDADCNSYGLLPIGGGGVTQTPRGVTQTPGVGSHRPQGGVTQTPKGSKGRRQGKDTILSPASLDDLLASALPDASAEERELILSDLSYRESQGEVQSPRAWLRTVIANGDAGELLDEARRLATDGPSLHRDAQEDEWRD